VICYFFSGNSYLRVTRGETGPGTVDPGYPTPIANWDWGTFGADGIDAALWSGPKCYFFSGNRYIRVSRGNRGAGSIDPGYPSPISDWNWGTFGAAGIDAALYSGCKCYFFSGNEYIRVTRGETDVGAVDPGYPAPISNWGWGAFGATGIDAALYSGNKCYFFSGDQYIRVTRGETGAGAIDAGYPASINIWNWGAFGENGINAALFSGMDDATGTYPPVTTPLAMSIQATLENITADAAACRSLYLDTTKDMWGKPGWLGTGYNHAQGLARTHLLSTDSVTFFLTYSEIGSEGTLSQYHYSGPLDGAHIAEQNVETDPAAIAPMEQIINVPDEHPADLVFMPDVNNMDAGYVFVTLQYQAWAVAVYSWQSGFLNIKGTITIGNLIPNEINALFGGGPGFLFLDKVGDFYYLGVAGGQLGLLFRAKTLDLFPSCTSGSMNVEKFEAVPPEDIVPPGIANAPPNTFAFPVNGDASQIKLIRDCTDQWFLLGFRCDPPDEAYSGGTDYIDIYPVTFSPFKIMPPTSFSPQHIIFPSDGTSFASTGTHFVDPLGRLLVSSCFRWAQDKSDIAGYVTRVDELSSS
jgi:hypothetical protein